MKINVCGLSSIFQGNGEAHATVRLPLVKLSLFVTITSIIHRAFSIILTKTLKSQYYFYFRDTRIPSTWCKFIEVRTNLKLTNSKPHKCVPAGFLSA